MKIALICDTLLLGKSLEMYLKDYLTSYKLCDFVVATQKTESKKPIFLIGDFEGAHLKIPFTKEILIQELESFYQKIKIESHNATPPKALEKSFESFEKAPLESFTQEAQQIQNTLESIEPSIQDIAQNSTLDAKLESILRCYMQEIKVAVLEHFKAQN